MALVVVLLLLLGLTVIAVAGLGGAVADLAIAALDEQSALALEAAEAGVARTLRSGVPIPAGTSPWPGRFPGLTLQTDIQFDAPSADMIPPVGTDPVAVRHFTILAESHAGRGAVARIEQGFRYLGPAGSNGACAGEHCPIDPPPAIADPPLPPELMSDPVKTSWRQLDTSME
jgi:hypothetical protein